MKKSRIILVSPSKAFADCGEALAAFSPIEISASQQLMPTLINRQAAMIFLDAQCDDWQALTLRCKSSAATRRIPICLVSDEADARATAIRIGADLAVSWAELAEQMAGLVADFARIPDRAWLAQLDCECAEALPALAAEGLRQFNRGEFYRQHDLFEEQWVNTAGPVRDLYRAILQVGVAYYQIERGNYRGAVKMLQRSVQWLYLLPDICQGVDVAQLRRDSYAVRAELGRLGPERFSEFNRALLKPLIVKSPQSPSR